MFKECCRFMGDAGMNHFHSSNVFAVPTTANREDDEVHAVYFRRPDDVSKYTGQVECLSYFPSYRICKDHKKRLKHNNHHVDDNILCNRFVDDKLISKFVFRRVEKDGDITDNNIDNIHFHEEDHEICEGGYDSSKKLEGNQSPSSEVKQYTYRDSESGFKDFQNKDK